MIIIQYIHTGGIIRVAKNRFVTATPLRHYDTDGEFICATLATYFVISSQ